MDASRLLEATAVESAGLLSAAADPVRWRLLAHLSTGVPACVCELQPVAGVAPNLLSYHLKVLREARLVTTTRRGRWVDYTIAPDALTRLRAALPAIPPSMIGAEPVATMSGPTSSRCHTLPAKPADVAL